MLLCEILTLFKNYKNLKKKFLCSDFFKYNFIKMNYHFILFYLILIDWNKFFF